MMRNKYRLILTALCLLLITVGLPAINCADDTIDMLTKAAKNGNATAQYNLGAFYYLGIKVPRNYTEAARWFEKSAAQDNPLAKGLLGVMYFKGQGVQQDYEKAYILLQQSADRGYGVAQTMLAGMYYVGQGVPQDYEKSAKWAILASGNHEKDAEKLLEKLREEASPEQLAAAQKEAHEWRVQRLPHYVPETDESQ